MKNTINDFINSNNSELLGKWGNFINRTLVFINKSFDGRIEDSNIDEDIENKLKELFNTVGNNIEDGKINEKTLNRLNMTKEDLYKVIFQEGYTKFEEIFILILKENGVFLLRYEK